MNPFDQHVGRDDLDRVPLRFDDGGIVADADQDVGWRRRHARADSLDERALAEV
jgi:hypothetical protein